MNWFYRPSSRRGFVVSLVAAPVAMMAAGRARAQTSAAVPSAPDCPAEDGGSMRDSLNYVGVSAHGAAQDCRNCDFWISEAAGAACGECTLISGPISPVGWCDAWAIAGGMVASGVAGAQAAQN